MKTEQDIIQAGSTEELTAVYEAWIAEQPYRKDYGCAMETKHGIYVGAIPGGVYELRWLEVFNERWDEVQALEDEIRGDDATGDIWELRVLRECSVREDVWHFASRTEAEKALQQIEDVVAANVDRFNPMPPTVTVEEAIRQFRELEGEF